MASTWWRLDMATHMVAFQRWRWDDGDAHGGVSTLVVHMVAFGNGGKGNDRISFACGF